MWSSYACETRPPSLRGISEPVWATSWPCWMTTASIFARMFTTMASPTRREPSDTRPRGTRLRQGQWPDQPGVYQWSFGWLLGTEWPWAPRMEVSSSSMISPWRCSGLTLGMKEVPQRWEALRFPASSPPHTHPCCSLTPAPGPAPAMLGRGHTHKHTHNKFQNEWHLVRLTASHEKCRKIKHSMRKEPINWNQTQFLQILEIRILKPL